jgi:hypothetical protein
MWQCLKFLLRQITLLPPQQYIWGCQDEVICATLSRRGNNTWTAKVVAD